MSDCKIKLFNVLGIETLNVCTRRCWFCKFGQERQDGARFEMRWETIERIVYNLKNLEYKGRVSWFGTNEPLSDRRIFDILKFTRRHVPRAYLTLNTNGDLLTEEVYGKLLEAGLDTLAVSIYDDKTYERVMRMEKKAALFVELDKRNSPLSSFENRGGNVKANADFFEQARRHYTTTSCARPSNMIVINPKGQVVLCCGDIYGDVVIGDVNEERLEIIWNNDKFSHYRQVLARGERQALKLCRTCSHGGVSSSMYYLLGIDSWVEQQIKMRGNWVPQLEQHRDWFEQAADEREYWIQHLEAYKHWAEHQIEQRRFPLQARLYAALRRRLLRYYNLGLSRGFEWLRPLKGRLQKHLLGAR